MPATTRAHAANKLKIVGGKYISSKAKIGGECSKAMSAWKSSKSGMPAGVGKILGKCRAQAQALRKGVMFREAGQELKAQVQEHRAFHGTVGVAARASEARAKIEARKQAQAARAKTTGPTGPSLREQVAASRAKDIRRATPESLAATKASVSARRAKQTKDRFTGLRDEIMPGPSSLPRQTLQGGTKEAKERLKSQRSKRASKVLEAHAELLATPEAQARIKTQAARATAHDRARFPLFGGKLPTEIPYEHLAQARATAERLRAATGAGSTPGHAGPLAGGRETGIGTPTVKPPVDPHDFTKLDEFGKGHVSHAHPPGSPAHLSSAAGQKVTSRERRRLESKYAITHAATQAATARARAEERAVAFHKKQEERAAAEGKPVETGHTSYKERQEAIAKARAARVVDPDSMEGIMIANRAKQAAEAARKVTLPAVAPAAAQPTTHGLSDDIVKQHSAPYQGRHDPYMTHADAQAGYPETLKRLRAYSPEQLSKESADMRKASFDRMFGHNARKALTLVEQVQYEKQKIAGANAAAPMAVVSDRTKQATGDHGTVGHSGPLAGGRETGIGTKSLLEQVAAKRAKKGTVEERTGKLAAKAQAEKDKYEGQLKQLEFQAGRGEFLNRKYYGSGRSGKWEYERIKIAADNAKRQLGAAHSIVKHYGTRLKTIERVRSSALARANKKD